MEELISAKKHFSKIGWVFAAVSGIIFVLQAVVMLVINLAAPKVFDDINVQMLMSMVIMYLIGFSALYLALRKWVPAKTIERRRMTAGQFAVAVVMCLGIAYAANIVGVIITFVIGIITGNPVQNNAAEMIKDLNFGVLLLSTVVVAPVAEELLFRKMLIDRTIRYGQGISVVISGLMFGLFHGNLNQFMYAAAIGMFFAFIYVKTGNIKITMGMHAIMNFMGGVVSSSVVKAVDLEAYEKAAASGDMAAVISSVTENIGGWILYGIFLLYMLGMLVAGTVLVIVFLAKKRFTFDAGEIDIPRQLRFNLAAANSGMIMFALVWIAVIIMQLFS